ncbi:gephyrin-like molybdotransferase Glp [Bowdeniella nasicola]|nr:gephyrin-like molybdotransferase Glp [Bowdeniella nasicola]
MSSMITVEDHLSQVLTGAQALPTETRPIADCHGFVLATDCAARLAVPPFTNSAMDGFAVIADDVAAASKDTPVQLRVTADIPAGAAPDSEVVAGTAQRIMTGAMLPAGANAVVPVELTNIPAGPHELPETIEVYEPVTPGRHVRSIGDDVAVGAEIVTAGTRLSAAALSSLVSVGYGELEVYRRPRVAVLATGEELAEPGETPAPGHIPDSNTTLVAGLLREADCEVARVARTGDTPADLFAALQDAAASADLVITTGGVSAGAYDVVKEATAGAGITFSKVAMQPGKPQGHGLIEAANGRRVPMLCLPGNPVSVFVSFQMFARPILALLAGQGLAAATHIHARRMATTTVGWKAPAGRRQLAPVRLTEAERPGDLPTIIPTHRLGSGSHLVASLHKANALAVVPEETDEVAPWDVLEVIEL